MTFKEQQARRRSVLIWTAVLCCCCCFPACLLPPGRWLFVPAIADRFYDRAATLREKTGLELPASARVRDFYYAEGLRGDGMLLSFDAPSKQAAAFLSEEPLARAEWEERDERLLDEAFSTKDPKGLYRTTTIKPSPREWIVVDAKDRQDGTWRIWVHWGVE